MNPSRITKLVDNLIQGDITADDHAELQSVLKTDAEARRLLRERMDLEAGLRTWAQEGNETPAIKTYDREPGRIGKSRLVVAFAALSTLACLVVILLTHSSQDDDQQLAEQQQKQALPKENNPPKIGTVRSSSNARWSADDRAESDRFGIERLTLSAGIAELIFDSGTNLILQAPCELEITAADAAHLLRGSVFVNVTEQANGFVLDTPEASIVDEGTKYAVVLDESETEVHVFEGRVVWVAAEGQTKREDLIEAGEARRYDRRSPGQFRRVPFGQREFVRQLDHQVQESGGGELLAYDGFENIAGRLRRGRSGFGWEDGWSSSGRRRGPLAEVVGAPAGIVFGMDRNGRKRLKLTNSDLRRLLKTPIGFEETKSVYISFLLERDKESVANEGSASFRLAMESQSSFPRRRPPAVSFGISSEGFPYVNIVDKIDETAVRLTHSAPLFVVVKLTLDEERTSVAARIYHDKESIDGAEPAAWSVQGESTGAFAGLYSIRLTANGDTPWYIDELRVATRWAAVTAHHPD